MRFTINRWAMLSTFAGCFTMLLLAGCNRVPIAEFAAAEGVVTINGKPAANIMVQFLPVVEPGELGPTSSGISNDAGQFELMADNGEFGAVIGTCKVLFIDMDEERVPQGVAAKPPRLSSALAIVGPRTQEVVVRDADNPPFAFNLEN